MSKKCAVEGCDNKHYCKGYCKKHYMQFYRHGRIIDNEPKSKIINYTDYAEIVLYNKQGIEVGRTIIDVEIIETVKNYKWWLDGHGYVQNDEIGSLHRFIMNPPDDLVVDHINHNPLDNRRENLRICTIQENNMNRSISSNNTSGTVGVHWNKTHNKWMAYIGINGKQKYLGLFNKKEDAIEARRQAEIEYFGEFSPQLQDA